MSATNEEASAGSTATETQPTLPADTDAAAPLSGASDEPLPHRKLVFAICGAALCMTAIDATIVATALPRIATALHGRLNWVGWTVTIYQLGTLVAMPLAGKIGDQFGRKRIFLICMILFTASSLACGLSTSIAMLIPLRFVQAIGGGAFTPSVFGIVSDHFGRDRDRAVGMVTSIIPIGGVAGPIFGGVIAQYWSWRGIFFINLPIGIVLIVLAARFIPRAATRDVSRFDVLGACLLAVTILTGMFAITLLGEQNVSPGDPAFFVPALSACLFGRLFIRHIKRVDEPVLAYRLLRGRGFAVMNVINFMYGGAAQGFAVLVPLYAENRYGFSISSAGTLFSARSAAMVVVAGLAAMYIRVTGYRIPMIVGFLLVALGVTMIAIEPLGMSAYPWLVLWSAMTGIGLGGATPATNNAILQLAPDQVGSVSGLRGMFRQGGSIFYLSVATAVLARSTEPASTQAHIFFVQAAALVVMAALVFAVPDYRGRW